MQKYNFSANHLFDTAHAEFQESKLFKRLTSKFTPKPFHVSHRSQFLLADFTSYILNALSAGTAFVFVFMFLSSIIPAPLGAAACGGTLLVILEAYKRSAFPPIVVYWLQYRQIKPIAIAVVLGLSALSIAASYHGAKYTIAALTQPPTLLDEGGPALKYKDQITSIEQSIARQEATTWKGRVTRQANENIKILQERLQTIEAQVLAETNKIVAKNEQETRKHEISTSLKAEHFALFTLGCELLFLICLGFINYYDYRSLSEFSTHNAPTPDSKPETKDNEGRSSDTDTDTPNPSRSNAGRSTKGKTNSRVSRQTPVITAKEDLYTIEHNGKRYTLEQVRSMAGIYEKRIEEHDKGGTAAQWHNLDYWRDREQELIKKTQKGEGSA